MAVNRSRIRWGLGGPLLMGLSAGAVALAMQLSRGIVQPPPEIAERFRGLSPGNAPHSTGPQALPVLGEAPAFSLVDQAGRPFTRDDVRGRVWIADFIFTRCAGQCPLMSAAMARLSQALPDVWWVSFSLDPAHDSPVALAEYARAHHADPARWRFATGGDGDAMRRWCQEGFKLSATEGGPTDEPIIHSRRFVLVDRQVRIRGYYDAGEPAGLAALQRAARQLAHEAP